MLRNMNRSLSIVTANQADIPSLVQIYFNSFTTNFRKQAFPDTVSTRRWWEQKLAKEMKSSNALFLKAVDLEKSTDEEKIVAWAHWSFQKQQKNCSPPRNSWPGEADVELCEKHFGDLEKKHQHLMHGRQHWCKLTFKKLDTSAGVVTNFNDTSRSRVSCDRPSTPGSRRRRYADQARSICCRCCRVGDISRSTIPRCANLSKIWVRRKELCGCRRTGEGFGRCV